MNKWQRLYAKKKARGICTRDSNPAHPGATLCWECLCKRGERRIKRPGSRLPNKWETVPWWSWKPPLIAHVLGVTQQAVHAHIKKRKAR